MEPCTNFIGTYGDNSWYLAQPTEDETCLLFRRVTDCLLCWMVVMSILTGTMSLGRRLQATAYATRMRNSCDRTDTKDAERSFIHT